MVTQQQILQLVEEYTSQSVSSAPFRPGKTYIPPTYPQVLPEDIATLVKVALDGWFTEWGWAQKFKNQLCVRMDQNHAVLTNSGSSATLVAVAACVEQSRMSEAPYVLTTAVGFPTTVSSIYHAGKMPFYVDLDADTLSPNLDQIYRALQDHGKDICGAIFAHTMGFPFEEPTVADMLGSRRFLVSDACDALGACWLDPISGGFRNVGYHANATTLSFFPAHHITTAGEGGAVLTNHPDLAEVITSLVNWGRDCTCLPGQSNTCGQRFCHPNHGDMPATWDHKYLFSRLGYNLKMTELQAGMGWSQISRLIEMNRLRWKNYLYLRDGLDDLYPELRFVSIPDASRPSPFGMPLMTDDVSGLITFLEAHRIGTRRLFGGNLTKQPGYRDLTYACNLNLTGSEQVTSEMFWIACGPTLTREMMDYMIEVVHQYFTI